jgi:hypothetical protein
MADVKIRKLDERLVAHYRARAAADGLTLEEALRRGLAEAADRRRRAAIERADRLRARLAKKYGVMRDSVELIRAEREERERRIAGR